MIAGAPPVAILSRSDVATLMTPADYLEAVDAGFRALQDGSAQVPPPWHIAVDDGGFHGKGASLRLGERLFVALKLNGNFPGNPAANGLPTIQGAILLCDGETGSPLAIMDSIEVTLRRTAAATALAAQHLARPDAATLLMCGCGDQARPQIEALREVLPLARVLAWDRDPSRARQLACEGLETRIVDDLAEAAGTADVIVTCTTATKPFLTAGMVRPGTFVAAVGADAPHKSEIDPGLMTRALVVADSLAQCQVMGDLHHAIEAGVMTEADVHAELAELVAGSRPGRTADAEVTVFDSTGTAVQDVAVAIRIHERALASGMGTQTALGR